MSYWYLATPYSDYHAGHAIAAIEAGVGVAKIQAKHNLRIFSPIAHFHPIAQALDLHGHEFWMAVDKLFMERAEGCIVYMMPGWETSIGVNMEIDYFTAADKPVLFERF